jgi:hypothetical protein
VLNLEKTCFFVSLNSRPAFYVIESSFLSRRLSTSLLVTAESGNQAGRPGVRSQESGARSQEPREREEGRAGEWACSGVVEWWNGGMVEWWNEKEGE